MSGDWISVPDGWMDPAPDEEWVQSWEDELPWFPWDENNPRCYLEWWEWGPLNGDMYELLDFYSPRPRWVSDRP